MVEPDLESRDRPPLLPGCAFAFFATCTLLWCGSTFQNMTPSCSGPYDERAYFAAGAILGPLRGVLIHRSDGLLDTAVGLGAIAAFVGLVALTRSRPRLRLTLLLATIPWTFLGCVGGIPRIT